MASATYNPDASPESTSVDGYITYEPGSGTWATHRNAAAGSTAYDSAATASGLYVRQNGGSPNYDIFRRAFFLFDTSALPDDAIISAATFRLYVNSKGDTIGGTPKITLVGANPASNTAIATGDYDQVYGDLPVAGYWAFDESSGTSLYDRSPNGNTGTNTGGSFVSGVLNNCLSFGFYDDDIVTIPDATAIQNIWDGGGAVSVWIKPSSDGQSDVGRVFDKTATGSQGWALTVSSESAGYVNLYFIEKFSVSDGQWVTGIIIPINTWSHIVINYNSDSTSNDPTIYVNGTSVTVTELAAPSGTRLTDATRDLCIANRSANDTAFEGSIDEVFLFSSTLTTDQITQLYTNPARNFSTPLALSSVSTGAYNDISLNSSGIAAISKTGVTKLALVFEHDRANTEPAWVSNFSEWYLNFTFADNGSNKPELVITYTTPTNNANKMFLTFVPL